MDTKTRIEEMLADFQRAVNTAAVEKAAEILRGQMTTPFEDIAWGVGQAAMAALRQAVSEYAEPYTTKRQVQA